jgi:hypothetical protein
VCLAGCLSLFAVSSAAALENENLLVGVPPGYKIDFNDRKQTMIMTEMVPTAQTVQNWTEMVTVQIFLGLKSTPAEFRTRMEKLWSGACPAGSGNVVSSASENGYATLLWRQSCPLNKATGKPEMTWFKAIAGNDSFYVVQKAFKFEPSPEQLTQWLGYLSKVSVCDTRLSARKCPAGMK